METEKKERTDVSAPAVILVGFHAAVYEPEGMLMQELCKFNERGFETERRTIWPGRYPRLGMISESVIG